MPKKPQTQMLVPIATRITPKQKKQIADEAYKQRISQGQLFRNIINHYFLK